MCEGRTAIVVYLLLALCGVGVITACSTNNKSTSDGGVDTSTGPDTDTDVDSDSDTDTDSDTDSDTDTDTESESDTDTSSDDTLPDCPGGKLDVATDLCWQHPPPVETMLYGAAYDYCNDLTEGGFLDWRLPLIQELLSLVVGCGPCGVHDPDCLVSACSEGPECAACERYDGPGPGGCYWNAAFGDECGLVSWLSDSEVTDQSSYVWNARFDRGDPGWVNTALVGNRVRCVRDVP